MTEEIQNKAVSGNDLKQTLWDTLISLKSGDVSIDEAATVASVAREIVRVTNTQFKVLTFNDQAVVGSLKSFVS